MIFETDEVLEMGNIPSLWEHMNDRYRAVCEADARQSDRLLTVRARDEAQPAGHRTYIAARRGIAVCHESAMNLWFLVEAGKVTPLAPMFLLRPIIEAAFHTTYMLEPTESLIRRRRGLAREIEDHRQQQAWARECVSVLDAETQAELTAGAAERRAKYEAEATKLGTTFERLRQDGKNVSVTDGLSKLDTLRIYEDSTRRAIIGAWRFLSGCDHGFAYPMVFGATKVHDHPIPGGFERTLTVRDETFRTLCGAAALMNLAAMDLYIDRSTQS